MNTVRTLRIVTLVEGVVYLLLLFVAMPLKYVYLMPTAVRIAGAVHGVLFLVFLSVLYRAALERDWPHHRSLRVFGAGLLPFGFVFVDRWLRKEEALGT